MPNSFIAEVRKSEFYPSKPNQSKSIMRNSIVEMAQNESKDNITKPGKKSQEEKPGFWKKIMNSSFKEKKIETKKQIVNQTINRPIVQVNQVKKSDSSKNEKYNKKSDSTKESISSKKSKKPNESKARITAKPEKSGEFNFKK